MTGRMEGRIRVCGAIARSQARLLTLSNITAGSAEANRVGGHGADGLVPPRAYALIAVTALVAVIAVG